MSHHPEGFWCLVFLVLQSVIRYRYPKTLSILCFQHSSESRHMRRENHVIQHMTAALTSTATKIPDNPNFHHYITHPLPAFTRFLSCHPTITNKHVALPQDMTSPSSIAKCLLFLCHNLISSLLSYLFVLSQEHTFTMLILGCFLIPYAQHSSGKSKIYRRSPVKYVG